MLTTQHPTALYSGGGDVLDLSLARDCREVIELLFDGEVAGLVLHVEVDGLTAPITSLVATGTHAVELTIEPEHVPRAVTSEWRLIHTDGDGKPREILRGVWHVR